MAKGFIAKDTCSFKVGIYQNRDGNILQEGETVAGQKNFTFGEFKSDFFSLQAIFFCRKFFLKIEKVFEKIY